MDTYIYICIFFPFSYCILFFLFLLFFLAIPKTASKILKKNVFKENAGGFPNYPKEGPPPNHFSSRKLSEPSKKNKSTTYISSLKIYP